MAVIDVLGQAVTDLWALPGEENPSGRTELLALAGLLAADSSGLARPLGIVLSSDAKPEQLAPFVEQIDLIAVEFPKFRDGRGFTIARYLRERLGFSGELRAVGHVIPDQLDALAACGFSSILLPPDHPAEQWARGPGRKSASPLLRRSLGRALERT
jgi:uncharacterized protein (DUF934 family)